MTNENREQRCGYILETSTCKQCEGNWTWARYLNVSGLQPKWKYCATCAAKRWHATLKSEGARAMAERRQTGGRLH